MGRALAVRAGLVIDGLGNAFEDATVLVGPDGRIEGVEPRRPADSGRTVVDWSRFAVMPGMVDCHDHLAIDLGDEAGQARESPARHVIRAIGNARRLVEAGITTLRDVGEKAYVDIELRDAIARGELLGPRVLCAGQFISRTGGHGWYFGEEADGVDEVVKAVRRQVKHGADLIKIMATGGMGTPGSDPTAPGYSRAEIHAAVAEAHALGRRVAAHLHGGPAAAWAIEAGIDSIEHGVFLTPSDLKEMKERGTYLVSTAAVGLHAATDPGIPEDYRRKAQAGMQAMRDMLKEAVRLGVRIAIGGDTYHARPDEELEALVEAGMSPMQALIAATRAGAVLAGVDSVTGSITPGRAADLVALRANPLERVSAVREVAGVMMAGRIVVGSGE